MKHVQNEVHSMNHNGENTNTKFHNLKQIPNVDNSFNKTTGNQAKSSQYQYPKTTINGKQTDHINSFQLASLPSRLIVLLVAGSLVQNAIHLSHIICSEVRSHVDVITHEGHEPFFGNVERCKEHVLAIPTSQNLQNPHTSSLKTNSH